MQCKWKRFYVTQNLNLRFLLQIIVCSIVNNVDKTKCHKIRV